MTVFRRTYLTLFLIYTPFCAYAQNRSPRNYEECRKSALRLYRNDLDRQKFQNRLDTCFHRFPGSGEYLACKRKALRSKSRDGLKKCRQILKKLTYHPSQPLPISTHRNRFYFAGTSLNSSKHLEQFSPIHFDCGFLQKAMQTGEGVQWNAPSTPLQDLKGFQGWHTRDILRKLGVRHISGRDGTKQTGLGRIKGNLRKNKSEIFFPTATCSFRNNDPNSLFAALSIRYLLTQDKSLITPLSGSAHYLSEAITFAELKPLLTKQIPKQLQSFPTRYGFYLAAERIDAFDDQNYPAQPCALKQAQWFIQIFKNTVKNNFVESIRILHMKNFCSYANQRIKPWVRNTEKTR